MCFSVSLFVSFVSDSYPGGLERSFVQRHGSHFTSCCSLLRGPHDVWELRPLQLVGGHLGRGLSSRGKETQYDISFKDIEVNNILSGHKNP